jgi:CelD/BcsL family acetyltransferase involved in cellulose biosynthesis
VEHLSLHIDSLSARELDRWRALADRTAEPNPFFEAEFATLAARHLDGGPELVVVADGDEWVACLPVVRSDRWRRFPARWVISWRHPYSYLGTPLVDRDRCRPACAALVDALASAPGGLVALELVDPDGPVGQGLAAALAERRRPLMRYETHQRATLARRPEPTYLDDTLSRSRRKELRRQGRRLSEAVGEAAETRDTSTDASAVDAFLALESSGWKGREATAMESQSEHAAFFREMCATLRERGRLQMLTLGAPDRAVAMQCNLIAGDTLFCLKVAYDEELGRFSPGVQLEVAAVDAFHAADTLALVDSCAEPDNELINGLWPDRRTLSTLVFPAAGARGRMRLRALGLGAAIRRRTRR